MTTFWSGWIIVLTVGNILACVWLVWWTMRKRKDESASGDVTGHTWDGDLQEYNNPLPRWWLWLFYLTVVFSIIYLILFPGLGNFKGVLGWTQQEQYEEQMAQAEAKYGPIFAAYAEQAIPDLAEDPEALEDEYLGALGLKRADYANRGQPSWAASGVAWVRPAAAGPGCP